MSAWMQFLSLHLLALPAAAGGGALALGGPPEIGGSLALELTGAPPDAPLILLASFEEGSLRLPFGTLELSPEGLFSAAAGATDSQGRASFVAAVASPALAEADLHLQALVADPETLEIALSGALHLRLLGSRVYVALTQAGTPGLLQVRSALHGGVVFERGDPILAQERPSTAGGDELPLIVFDAESARAAYVPDGGRVVVFDNFFGDGVAEFVQPGLAPQLLAAVGGRSLYALDVENGRILEVDFATGALRRALVLSRPIAAGWTAEPEGRFAFLPTAEAQGWSSPSWFPLALRARAPCETSRGRARGSPPWG